MFSQSVSRRALQPLSRLSRSNLSAMPLRAKIQNVAFTQSSNMGEAAIPKELPGDEPDDVLFGSIYGVRSIELNRPKKLNSLNGSMARKILPRLKEWEKSQLANVIIISGKGKALCAGGDVGALAVLNKKGPDGQQQSKDFFALEYTLDHVIATYQKPYISYMDGHTMGGGVGLSVHAPFRIATENTVFAMPETKIGFFPDVGGGFFLPRLDGFVGRYLALTSETLKGVQAYYAGIGTHYIHSSSLADLTSRLSELNFNDQASYNDRLELINATIDEFSSGLPHDQTPIFVGARREAIDRCFKYSTIEEILKALERESQNDRNSEVTREWARRTSETMLQRSPTSLKVTLRQLIIGRSWNITETFQQEQNIASRFMEHPDFIEGVEVVLQKKPRTAEWRPAKLEDVTTEQVDSFFETSGKQKLQLLSEGNYKEYDEIAKSGRRSFALPTERDVHRIVGSRRTINEDSLLQEIEKIYGPKLGAKDKVREIIKRKCIIDDNGALKWDGE